MSDGVAVCVLNIHVDARKNKTIDRLSQETRDIPPPPPLLPSHYMEHHTFYISASAGIPAPDLGLISL